MIRIPGIDKYGLYPDSPLSFLFFTSDKNQFPSNTAADKTAITLKSVTKLAKKRFSFIQKFLRPAHPLRLHHF